MQLRVGTETPYRILLKYLPSKSNPAAFFQHILSYISAKVFFFFVN